MGNPPLISIIVPVYNVEDYIRKCILSITAQTYKNIQIILVDDGSKDQSGQICDEFMKADKRISVVHKRNSGIVGARKAGLALAKGTYIGFVDSDDFIKRDMYEEMVKNILLTGADFVHTGFYKGTSTVSQLENALIDVSRDRDTFIKQYILSSDNECQMTPSIWSKLFKAELIKKSFYEVPEELVVGEDLVSLIACAIYSKKVSILDSSYYNYCVRSTSITHRKTETALLDSVRLFQAVENILKRHGCYDQVKETLVNEWLGVTICSSLLQTVRDEFKIQYYGIRNMKTLEGKNIVLYGAGKIGRDYYSQISRYSKCKLIAWIDKNYQNIHYDCIDLTAPERLEVLNFDVLIIAIKDEREAEKIKDDLVRNYKIDERKIVWIKPVYDY